MFKIQAVIYRIKNKKILLLKRKNSEWHLLTGNVEEYESILSALRREIFEETGIKEIKKLIFLDRYLFEKNHTNFIEYSYAVVVPENTEITFEYNPYQEHIDYKWVEYKESLNLLKWDIQKKSVVKLNKLITQ
ncbi:MAG: hypothetical protein B6U88_00770 [Candidatus Aenigmarchaeota archaeon ex4484_56]|nr:MAG: hypothetical protein B6U88_00770 [Candidatus Aenigmarchaeota archaeon ex4484_56]